MSALKDGRRVKMTNEEWQDFSYQCKVIKGDPSVVRYPEGYKAYRGGTTTSRMGDKYYRHTPIAWDGDGKGRSWATEWQTDEVPRIWEEITDE
jgi:hypothetical protein